MRFYINIKMSIHIIFSVSFSKLIIFKNKNIYLDEAKNASSSESIKIMYLFILNFFCTFNQKINVKLVLLMIFYKNESSCMKNYHVFDQ